MRRSLIATLLILCATALPATAEAAKRPVVGIGDNHPEAFQNTHMRKLPALKTARLVIPWDWYKSPYQIFRADSWIHSVKLAHKKPLVAFNRNWGRKGRKQVPRMKAYVKGFKQFRKRFPHVREFSAWNEPNAVEQPFARKPGKAATYFNALRRACRRCTIVAGDLKDGKTMGPYLRTYKKKVRGAKIWALHNYKDATRKRKFTAEFLRTVRGQRVADRDRRAAQPRRAQGSGEGRHPRLPARQVVAADQADLLLPVGLRSRQPLGLGVHRQERQAPAGVLRAAEGPAARSASANVDPRIEGERGRVHFVPLARSRSARGTLCSSWRAFRSTRVAERDEWNEIHTRAPPQCRSSSA